MGAIRVEIVSAEIAIFSGEASMVVAPGKDGDLGIAPKHTPLLTTLRPKRGKKGCVLWGDSQITVLAWCNNH